MIKIDHDLIYKTNISALFRPNLDYPLPDYPIPDEHRIITFH